MPSNKVEKPYFAYIEKNRKLDLPIDCQLKLFDNTLLPVLLQGCENGAYGDLEQFEKVHTDFLKRILHVRQQHATRYVIW